MTEQTKSVVELAHEMTGGSTSASWVTTTHEGLIKIGEAYAAQAIEQYKQELLKGVGLPERRALPVKASGIFGHALGYTKDQLQQAIAGAVLPLKAEIAISDARLHEVATACATAEQERDTLQSRVTQLEQELDDARKQMHEESAISVNFMFNTHSKIVVERDALKSQVTQLEQELSEALAYKQDAELLRKLLDQMYDTRRKQGERAMIYIFHRSGNDGAFFYPVDLKDDADALENVKCNPGTTKVTTPEGRTVWEGDPS